MISQEAIDAVRAELAPAQGGDPDTWFGLLFLEQEHHIPRDQAAGQVAFAGNDYGVNGYHVSAELKNLYLYHFAWSEKRNCFHVPLQQLAESGLDRIFGEGPPGIAPDQFLMKLKSQMLAHQSGIERVFVRLVFPGDAGVAERSAVHAKLREELENKKHLMDRFFGHPVTMAFEFRSARDDRIGAFAHQGATHAYPLRIKNTIVMNGPGGEVMRLGVARLSELYAMYRDMGSRFFESNIRYVLSEETGTNRSLHQAFREIILAGKRDPLVFTFDHNGITLYAERIEQRGDEMIVTEPRLLNGAQTIAVYDRFLKDHSGNPDLARHREAADELAVLCKIITDARSDFVLNVTLNNNRQNPVHPWNLHANDLIQLELQDKFREDLGIYYERQEKSFLSLSGEELEEMDIKEQKAIHLLKLTQTFLASDGELDRMSALQSVFETPEEYARVFHSKRLLADSRLIVLCYKIHFRLGRIIREIMERGERKYFYMRRARNLVWALLCQAVLNDGKLEEHAGAFGRKLGMETGLTELLAHLASTRVRFLVSSAVEDPQYGRKIEQERYGFLRTRAIFEACLDQGREKFGWTRKRL